VVLTIDKSGQLVPFLFPSKPAEGGSAEEKVAGEIPEGTNEKATSGDASSSEDADYANPASIKDRDVYKAYFRSVGWVHTSIFILGTMSFAVAIRFTGMCDLNRGRMGRGLTRKKQTFGFGGGLKTRASKARNGAPDFGWGCMHFWALCPFLWSALQ